MSQPILQKDTGADWSFLTPAKVDMVHIIADIV
jgi:hypothetical protein